MLGINVLFCFGSGEISRTTIKCQSLLRAYLEMHHVIPESRNRESIAPGGVDSRSTACGNDDRRNVVICGVNWLTRG